MKSVVHINFYDSGGGAAQVSEDLSNYFDQHILCGVKKSNNLRSHQISQKGFRPYIFRCIDRILKVIFPDSNFFRKIYYHLPKKINTVLYNRPLRSRDLFFVHSSMFSTIKNLNLECKFQDSRIIHIHNIHGAYFDLNALKSFKKLNKKIVWTLHDMWLLTGGEAHTFGDMGFIDGVAYTPFDNTYPFPHYRLIDKRKCLMRRKKEVLDYIADSCVLVPNSFWLEDITRKSFVINDRIKIKTIHPGIDTQIFYNKNIRNWNRIRIGFFDSGSPFKNSNQFYNTINKVLKRINKQVDVFIKNPVLKPEFEFVELHHVANHSELREIYNQLDILIFPSIADTFPLTTLEAMACGVCVVANNICGIPEQIKSGIDGFLVNPESNEMAELLIDIIDNKELEWIREIGKKASESVKENFDIIKMYREYSDVYKGFNFEK